MMLWRLYYIKLLISWYNLQTMAWYEAFITLKITDWYNLQTMAWYEAFITLKLLTGITSKPLLPSNYLLV